ncbi:hypothetical protein GCM10018793_45410 [Streptomyces sulfonofaciens]|uniref:Uncharacterized protein n=1 Tax=Streptomyces sulfonofaciens TaxID=68272 RepID=A0A919GF37_9ACTN|nr:hypothetical protein GCM10018793_45410 [Streptomyces sulfonofaciens]
MRQWQEHLAAGMRTLRRHGRLPDSLDVDEEAAALLAGVQGGVSPAHTMLSAKVRRAPAREAGPVELAFRAQCSMTHRRNDRSGAWRTLSRSSHTGEFEFRSAYCPRFRMPWLPLAWWIRKRSDADGTEQFFCPYPIGRPICLRRRGLGW